MALVKTVAILFEMEDLCSLYGVDKQGRTPGQVLSRTIKNAARQNGKVVVLIDEYDAPLLDVLHEKERLGAMKEVMKEFFQPLKACEAMIRFCFLTGITKFSQLSIFSTLNNIMNVSMMPKYSAICGITEEELTTVLKEDIAMLAEAYKCSPEEMHTLLKRQYDGYHFSGRGPEVYNPYSLINCFNQKEIKNCLVGFSKEKEPSKIEQDWSSTVHVYTWACRLIVFSMWLFQCLSTKTLGYAGPRSLYPYFSRSASLSIPINVSRCITLIHGHFY